MSSKDKEYESASQRKVRTRVGSSRCWGHKTCLTFFEARHWSYFYVYERGQYILVIKRESKKGGKGEKGNRKVEPKVDLDAQHGRETDRG